MIENKDSLQENAQNLSKNKLGGTHTTVIGGAEKLIKLISQHPELKVIPSVIRKVLQKTCRKSPAS